VFWVSATMDVAFTQNTNDYYPWWYSPKTPTTIIHPWWYSPKTPTTIYPWRYSPKTPTTVIHSGTHPKHQRLLPMVTLTQNTNDYHPWLNSPKTPTTIIHSGTHPKHQRLLSIVARLVFWVSATMDNSCWCFG
jgi:hypothetical protein